MSNIKLVHSGGNSVSLTTPDSNPASKSYFQITSMPTGVLDNFYKLMEMVHSHLQ